MPPFRPNCPAELAAILDFLWDSLEEQGLRHDEVWEPDDSSYVCTVGCIDADDHCQLGFVGLNPATHVLSFIGWRNEVERREQMEGVKDEDSRCGIDCKSADLFLAFLIGEFRRVEAKWRQIRLDAERQT